LGIHHLGGRRIQNRAGQSVGRRGGLRGLRERTGVNEKEKGKKKRAIRATQMNWRIEMDRFHWGPWAKSDVETSRSLTLAR
jgi:hypothetical protein